MNWVNWMNGIKWTNVINLVNEVIGGEWDAWVEMAEWG